MKTVIIRLPFSNTALEDHGMSSSLEKKIIFITEFYTQAVSNDLREVHVM